MTTTRVAATAFSAPKGVSHHGTQENFRLVDEFLPVYEVSDTAAMVVDAEAAIAWEALTEVVRRITQVRSRFVEYRSTHPVTSRQRENRSPYHR
jgi:hypothetical protein